MAMDILNKAANTTLVSAIFPVARMKGELVAFLDPDGQALTYRQSFIAIETIVDALLKLGIAGHDRVGFLVPRGPMGALGFLAISSVAACCPLNPRMRSEEFQRTIETMGITAIVTVGDTSDQAPAIKALPTLSLGPGSPEPLVVSISNPRSATPSPIAPAVALLMQTSGTTSLPKLVELSHAHILHAACTIRNAFGLNEADLCLNPMPLHHVHGLINATLSSLVSGSRVTCTDGFSPGAFEYLLETFQATWFTGSPAMHLALLEHFKAQSRKPHLPKLRFFRSSSAPLPASAIVDLEELFSAPLIETYGLTETASMICANPLPPAERKPGSVGITFGSQIRIVDELGSARGPNETGEIIVRGPSVIAKYGAGGQNCFFDGWLRTGDIGYLDHDGYLFVVGRTKELIKRGGLSVYPAEVDNLLMSHPDVAEAVTFSVPHPTLGEELVAAVVARAGTQPTDKLLKAHLAAELSAYKVPTAILVIDRIPKSDTGKTLRRTMAEGLAAFLTPQQVPAENGDEEELLLAWKQTIGRDDFGVTDNVFLLGGDPLRAERLLGVVANGIGASMSVKDLLATPTVREQVALATCRRSSAA